MNKFNVEEYLTRLNVNKINFGLENISALLARMGNPQNACPAILIGGTNGKGSTAAILDSILRQTGLKVGLYTSPHLVDVRERIRLNGKIISRREFCGILQEIKNLASEPLTYFEVLTAAAFMYFQRQKADYAVLEVGLGGRLDATNVCCPQVSIVTNIGLEHTNYLGRTLTAIAREKAGIIKKNGICVTGVTRQKVVQTLQSVCRGKNSAFYRLGADFHIYQQANGLALYQSRRKCLNNLEIPLAGAHQLSNAALALAALEKAENSGVAVSEAAIRTGLKKIRWEGRMEILCQHPLFLVDGAHNPPGIHALVSTLQKDYPGRRRILIFAALTDKSVKKMLQKIAPLADVIVLPGLQTERAIPPRHLADILKARGGRIIVAESVRRAMDRAFDLAGSGDMICAAGSLYLVGEIKEIFPEIICCDKGCGRER